MLTIRKHGFQKIHSLHNPWQTFNGHVYFPSRSLLPRLEKLYILSLSLSRSAETQSRSAAASRTFRGKSDASQLMTGFPCGHEKLYPYFRRVRTNISDTMGTYKCFVSRPVPSVPSCAPRLRCKVIAAPVEPSRVLVLRTVITNECRLRFDGDSSMFSVKRDTGP